MADSKNLSAVMRHPFRSPIRVRSNACTSSEDPIADWRGHLPLSGYYPCAGWDWRPVLVADVVETWLYVDYAPDGNGDPTNAIKPWLSAPPEGLVLETMIESVDPAALSSWAPWPYMPHWTEHDRRPVQLAAHQVAMFAQYRRPDGRPLRLMYVVGDATATFLAIFGRDPFTPWVLCLIQMGYGLGGGWIRFFDPEDPECVLRHAFRAHPKGMSPFILSNDYLPPTEFPVALDCEGIPGTSPDSGLQLRTTHGKYHPLVPDRNLLADLFPGFVALPSSSMGAPDSPDPGLGHRRH